MAKFTPGAIISEIRGSIGSTTFSRSNAGAIVKQKLTQPPSSTPAQVAVRAIMSAAVTAWQTIGQEIQNQWIAFASSQQSRARIDGTHKLSGFDSFVRFFAIRNQYGLSGNPIPAPKLPLGTYSAFLAAVSDSSAGVSLVGNNTNPDIMVVTRMSAPQSPGVNSISPTSVVILDFRTAPNGPLVIGVTAAWEARFGLLEESLGSKVFIRIDLVNRLTAQSITLFRTNRLIQTSNLLVAVSNTGIGNRAMASGSAVTWGSLNTPADNDWQSIVFSPDLGLFAAVAQSGVGNRIMTSPDGLAWTIQVSPADNSWLDVTWSPALGLFAAVAVNGVINSVMTSPDGINWTTRSAATINNWSAIAWSESIGLFAAVSNSGIGNRVMTSPDGINWTSRVSAADNAWRAIIYADNLALFIAVSTSGSGDRVMTSPDGINWTIQASSANKSWTSVAYSPTLNLLAAVAEAAGPQRVMTSPDGINWTTRNASSNIAWQSVIWSDNLELFVAVAASSTVNSIMTSPDGINWSAQVAPTANNWRGIALSL